MKEEVYKIFEHLVPLLEKIDADFYSKSGDKIEKEIKIKCGDEVFATIKDAGFEYVSSKFERNFLYDFKTSDNFQKGVVCRIRRERCLDDAKQNTILTLKKKIKSSDNVKNHIEYESVIKEDDLEKLDLAFQDVGLNPVFLYEKLRHTFKSRDFNVELVVDFLPSLGRYIEIEGMEDDILSMAKKLKFDNKNIMNSNYIELFKSLKNSDEKEHRFSKEEIFFVVENEMFLISKFWALSSCSGSCHSCGGSCSGCSSCK